MYFLFTNSFYSVPLGRKRLEQADKFILKPATYVNSESIRTQFNTYLSWQEGEEE
jgi:hypothetical protein